MSKVGDIVERYIDMRVKRDRPDGMLFWGFITNLAIGMTAVRDSWPLEDRILGLEMHQDGKLYIRDKLWVPTQEDILAEDWQIGD